MTTRHVCILENCYYVIQKLQWVLWLCETCVYYRSTGTTWYSNMCYGSADFAITWYSNACYRSTMTTQCGWYATSSNLFGDQCLARTPSHVSTTLTQVSVVRQTYPRLKHRSVSYVRRVHDINTGQFFTSGVCTTLRQVSVYVICVHDINTGQCRTSYVSMTLTQVSVVGHMCPRH